MPLSYAASLKQLNIHEIDKSVVAKQLGFTPVSKRGGPLKTTGRAYSQAVIDEVIRRGSEQVGERQLLVQSRATVAEGPRTQRTATSLIKSLDRYKNVAKYLIETEGNQNLYDLYQSIIRERESSNIRQAKYINLIFEHNTQNKSRVVALNNDDLGGEYGFQRFQKLLDDMESGRGTRVTGREHTTKKGVKIAEQTAGSDAINYNQYKLLLNKFIVTTHGYLAEGSSADIVYDCVGVVSETNCCGYECLRLCGIDIAVKPEFFQDFTNLLTYIKDNNLPIRVISNTFAIRKTFSFGEASYYTLDYRGQKISRPKYLIQEEHTIITELFKPTIAYTHTLIYDEHNCHIDLSTDKNPKFKTNVYLTPSYQVYFNDKILFTTKQILESTAPIATYLRDGNKFVFFDYETVIDYKQSNCMRAYSLSILVVNNDELDLLAAADAKKDQLKIDAIRSVFCKTFTGFDCSQQFIKWIRETEADCRYTFVGFNNTNFDNFILLDALLTSDDDCLLEETNVTNVFYNGSQLLNFTLNGRHNTFDIHKHLMCSLSANCESFKINCCAKKSFDHHKAQLLYGEGKLLEFVNESPELKEYNEYDVLATGVLFFKYRKALSEIKCTKEYAPELHNIKTVGSLIYKVLVAHTKKEKILFPQLNFKQYSDLQRSKIAGRVEMFNGIQKVEERLASTDVCSLYPYVMGVLNCYYPCGKLHEVDSYQGDDELGFYYCDIDQSSLKGRNLPNIYAYKTGMENKWDHTGVIENYLLSNVMIGLLLKFGCKVVIRNGFTFTERRKSCEMFKFLLDLMGAKNTQDDLKKSKVPEEKAKYNPALRETIKLLANSISGKIIEGLHTEKTVMVESAEAYLKIKDKAKSLNFINVIGDKLFLTYEMSAESMIKEQRPIYLGVLVYDYAKRYMYENSYSKIGLDRLLYTDTDASKFRYADMARWRDWIQTENVIVPHWPEVELVDPRYKNHLIYDTKSKVFGSFEDELEDCLGDKYTFYCLEKKSWFYGWSTGDKEDHKYRFKGINGGTQVLSDESFIKTKIVMKDGVPTPKKYLGGEEGEADEAFEERLHNFFAENKGNSLDHKAEKFFEQLYKDGSAYVLCSSFRKIVKNAARNVELDQTGKYNQLVNKIQVNVMMKKITLKR